jgi:hypothetical protein
LNDEHSKTREIPYHEYGIIADLLRAHAKEHAGQLKAMLAFGDLVTQGNTHDLDLLELVEGWDGKLFAEFHSSTDLPIRGQLRLYFLRPEHFCNPDLILDAADRQWVKTLLERIRQGYEVIMELPPGLVRGLIARQTAGSSTLTAPASGSVEITNPYELIRKRAS